MEPEHHVVKSACGEYVRDAWLIPGPADRPHGLCVFLDAEYYLNRGEFMKALRDLMRIKTGGIPAATCVFVSNLNGEARHYDYTCNPRYARFIAEDVVGWARTMSKVRDDDHSIFGVSLSGLASADIVLRYPEVFSRALCQSGSFWWLEGREPGYPHTHARLWMSVGDKELGSGITHPPSNLYQGVSQMEGVEKAVGLFKSLGATVRHSVYQGGHTPRNWAAEFPKALKWLFGEEAA